MTLEPMLRHFLSGMGGHLASAISHGWQAAGMRDWLPLVAVWGLGLSAAEGIEHLDSPSSETRHPV